MNCCDAKNCCQRYLDKELQATEALAVERHLSDCHCCAEVFESQRAFHGLVKKMLCNCVEGKTPGLKASILDRIAQSSSAGKIINLYPHRYLSPNGGVATAAACMLMLSGVVGFQSVCLNKQCSMIMAAQSEHDNIVLGNRPVVASGTDTAILAKAISARIASNVGVPNLSGCDVKAETCGTVKIKGMPEGIYVKYIHCECQNQPLTLIVLDTPLMPRAEKMEDFFLARQDGHNVVSWRGADSGPLYMLVSKIPMKEALEVARLARK
jgi:hypothetical protein